LLDSKQIKKFVIPDDHIKLNKIDVLGSISSTSDYFHTQPPISGLHVCLAEHQTAGRGRFGRTWHAPFGANIYLSCRWLIEQDVSDFSGLSLMISLAVIEALTQLGVRDLSVKWPNDIIWQGKKLAGILVEMQAESNGITQVIIGIGINVNMSHLATTDIHQPWASVDTIMGQPQDRNKLVGLLISQLMQKLAIFNEQVFNYFRPLWSKYDNLSGKKISLKIGKKTIHGIAQGVNAQGYLLIEDHDHVVHACSSGEATILK
jgi:BirA family biotin operon repressor/biotin-[acetyl-CoA-carboxylase] ligase